MTVQSLYDENERIENFSGLTTTYMMGMWTRWSCSCAAKPVVLTIPVLQPWYSGMTRYPADTGKTTWEAPGEMP